MGMFDSVHVKCPHCGEFVEFQSKAGDCILRDYQPDDVPSDIALDVDGKVSECQNCKELVKIVIDTIPVLTVRMKGV